MSSTGHTPKNPFQGAAVVVFGLGRFGGGVGAARFLHARGAKVLGTDLRRAEELPEALAALGGLDVELVLGEHREADFTRADLVVANPAVAPSHPLLALARARGARVTTEVELFLGELPCPAAALTGTQGKSSTTTFTAQLLAAQGFAVHAGGNLGGSLLDRLGEIGPSDRVVLELSSYQLEHLQSPPQGVRPLAAAAVLNLLEDHLERHGTREAYGAAKGRIFELLAEGGLAILPAGEPLSAQWPVPEGARTLLLDPSPGPGAGPDRADRLWIDPKGPDGRPWFRGAGAALAPLDALGHAPPFQRPNALAAMALAGALGARPERFAEGLSELAPPPHRLGLLGTVDGRRVYDNGVSTTPDSTAAAIFALGRVGTLLVGGQSKRLDYGVLARAAKGRCALAVAFGASRGLLAALLRAEGVATLEEESLEAAARVALAETAPGEALLFSPACASFDAFPNFEQRARAFARALGLAPP